MLLFTLRTTDRRTDEDGASAVEYGLLVAAVAAIIVVIVFLLGGHVRAAFDRTCDTIGTNDNNNATAANCDAG